MSTGDIVITKVYFPEGQGLSSQVKNFVYYKFLIIISNYLFYLLQAEVPARRCL